MSFTKVFKGVSSALKDFGDLEVVTFEGKINLSGQAADARAAAQQAAQQAAQRATEAREAADAAPNDQALEQAATEAEAAAATAAKAAAAAGDASNFSFDDIVGQAQQNAEADFNILACTKSELDGDMMVFYDSDIGPGEKEEHRQLVETATANRQAVLNLFQDAITSIIKR